MFMGFHSMGAAGWLLMTLFWVGFLTLVVFAVVRLFPAGTTPHGPSRGSGDEPRKILDRRLASGEIDVPTYERLRSELDPQSPTEGR